MNYSERLNDVIPGGCHTYSRGDDQYPSNAPQIFEKGKGAYLYTPKGEKFLDYGMALRAVTLGYGEENVANAAIEQIWKGNNLTRASLVELEAAEAFVDLIPSIDMVKFAKNGSTVTSAAIKMARAYTGRKYIVRCFDHPFFSYDDWFIGDTPLTRGIPQEHYALTLNFKYNDITSLKGLFEKYPNQIAGVILEPATSSHPIDNFLHKVKELCHKNGALFILDEMITGFRWHLQGAQVYYDVDPDLCTFGKGMANGFSVAALAGKREFMRIGGIKEEGSERVFLTSTTHGAEMCGLGALIRTIQFYKENNVVEHMWNYGRKLIRGMNEIAKEFSISECFEVGGIECSPNYITRDANKNISLAFRTLFSQEMIRNGVLMPWIAVSYSHTDVELEKTLEVTREALKVYSKALNDGVEKHLQGAVIKPVFRKYN
ncbi:glutamate-1-semialdehyde 2,1-aminomutase [Capnocytophaga felis]|uniref:Glutamate-1-semialdehyde 2,1-aminomutase n=1 Tax=Capnocytophaga felis TaxID=2267611 RepID=A0A5M4B7E2_9FLAO|nr:glutamate-1-semialdehyde 2,1-aminomutase [Capnocytophaga felis]GET45280.1 glutamate-1-semialdehyde 2,1-aminomutase [Capnocytophaga felis]GET47557.1 glutamate-1-semialdehyde 2,1-aminomutase [Capnocytophaga felis]